MVITTQDMTNNIYTLNITILDLIITALHSFIAVVAWNITALILIIVNVLKHYSTDHLIITAQDLKIT